MSAVASGALPFTDPAAGLLRRLASRLAAYRAYRRTYRSLDELSDHQLADIGLTRGQLHEIARSAS